MKEIVYFINSKFTIFDIPGTRIFIAFVIIIVALLFKRIFSQWVLKYLDHLTRKTKSNLDDALLEILNPPLSYLVLLLGFQLAAISVGVVDSLQKVIQLGYVGLMCWLIYRSADVFTVYLERLTKKNGNRTG